MGMHFQSATEITCWHSNRAHANNTANMTTCQQHPESRPIAEPNSISWAGLWSFIIDRFEIIADDPPRIGFIRIQTFTF